MAVIIPPVVENIVAYHEKIHRKVSFNRILAPIIRENIE